MISLGVECLAGKCAELFRLVNILKEVAFLRYFGFFVEYGIQLVCIALFQISENDIGIFRFERENRIAKSGIIAAHRHIREALAADGIYSDDAKKAVYHGVFELVLRLPHEHIGE